ncbi:protein FAR-RED IMPAIRED RESPONSE 1-like [Rhododendron vialii]|uniref:protein FAR-RED IMPAIRED RESPONSE 1-like n=1 Tax=Rhododendron vialii TaxID=182163 RepID=UPI00265E9DAC|nr:protein FAR-RED IMPAIRED RESPONSE 1-like [Rhododendron vialii]
MKKIKIKLRILKWVWNVNSVDEMYGYYSKYARQSGFVVFRRNLKRGANGEFKCVTLACTRSGKPRIRTSNPVKLRPQTKMECKAAVNAVLCSNGSWMLSSFVLDHNHEMSPSKSRFFKSNNRVLNQYVKRRLEINDAAGIRMNKNFGSLLSEAGGEHEKLPYSEKDCWNRVEKIRRLRLGEGDASAMLKYFQKMQAHNSNFFYSIDLNEEGRLRNVFWADARSRATFKEFSDVVTFDTTYLVNRYDMSFAPFVGVNHHGQSTLLGCALISKEDTKTFTWLFNCWLTCMSECAPPTIITDQDKAMKKAIEIVFPNTRHWCCIWHILNKILEKLKGYNEYEDISIHMLEVVYDSWTKEEFEENWGHFIEMYKLENNEWLLGLFDEREQWVPVFVNDIFWAGMSSTQRSEGMNSFFDSYINSKTTLQQFVEQYENALAKRVEKENEADSSSLNSYIPCFTQYELEEQFQRAYTLAKFKEVQNELVEMIHCNLNLSKAGDGFSEYEVREDVLCGKKKKRVIFKVCFKDNGSEVNCNCRLFESRGILCKHCIMVFLEKGIDRLPEKYILKR